MFSLSEDDALASVNKGWAPLIRRLYEEKPPDVEVYQVKEKYGGLRFYTGPAPEEYYDLISEVENESYRTCEVCGQPGSLDDSQYWMLTLCETHKSERAAETESIS